MTASPVELPTPTTRHPLPRWVEHVQPHQIAAINEAMECFDAGAHVVMVDAPTGSGKTLIGQRVAAEFDEPGLYVCSDKQLQQQFMRDFGYVGDADEMEEYAHLIQGRNNYATQHDPAKSAEDCTSTGPEDGCWFCDGYHTCAYQIAKRKAMRSNMAVLNTSYLLYAANYTKKRDFSGRALVVADECDELEGSLMGFVELYIGERLVSECHMDPPKKGVHKPTLMKWLGEFSQRVIELSQQQDEVKKQKKLYSLGEECRVVIREIERDIESNAADEDTGRWLRDYNDRAGLIMKPVTVAKYGNRYLWRHGKKWLIMSATIISGQEIAESLGITMPWEVVSVPSTFPVENRPVIMAPVANVVYKEMDEAVPRLVTAITRILEKHPGERTLVHAVSYNLADGLTRGLSACVDRPILTYSRASERQAVLARYLRTPGAVLVAPSMERGVDLKDDACRVQIIAKVPFPNLKDRQISARSRLEYPNGQLWYSVKAIRDVIQMAGRGVRHAEDRCTTYILDAQFATNLWRKNRALFPSHFRDAMNTQFNIRELL